MIIDNRKRKSTESTSAAPIEGRGTQIPKIKRKYKKKVLTRRRQRRPEEYVDTMAKQARNLGIEGVGRKEKIINARVKGPSCDDACRFKCNTKITELQRDIIKEHFWASGDISLQRQSIVNWVEEFDLHNSDADYSSDCSQNCDLNKKKKRKSYRYTFPTSTNPKEKVCRTIFLRTLGMI